jgi:hypothetical protein
LGLSSSHRGCAINAVADFCVEDADCQCRIVPFSQAIPDLTSRPHLLVRRIESLEKITDPINNAETNNHWSNRYSQEIKSLSGNQNRRILNSNNTILKPVYEYIA